MKKYAVILSSLAFLLTACSAAPADSVSATPRADGNARTYGRADPGARADGHAVPDACADDGGVR